MAKQESVGYFLPEPSQWPIVGSIGMFLMMLGLINWMHEHAIGPFLMLLGLGTLIYMMFGWFGAVIQESVSGLHNQQMDRTYRMGMCWFIFTEVMFFAAFFGTLFYMREFSGPWLSGHGGNSLETHQMIWPNFKFVWPLLVNPDNAKFVGAKHAMEAWGIPALNTAILLTSGVTVTWAHHALKKNNRSQLILGLALTILLGITFLGFQAFEYHHAYSEMGLTLAAGAYGSTFFMLTGFHGAHVTLGTIMLIVIWCRCLKGHFRPDHHFAFEGVSWYWHFVDVVWLFLFIFVYWL